MSLTESKMEETKKLIIEKAIESFYTNGIEETKISEIAYNCRVGISTVYRYFGTKAALIIAATEQLWEYMQAHIDRYFLQFMHDNKSGLMQVSDCMDIYFILYKNHRNYYRYLFQFNRFLSTEPNPAEYEALKKKLVFIKPYFLASVEKGKMDGTIRCEIDGKAVYRAISYFISGIAEKVVLFEKNGDVNDSTAEDFKMSMDMVLCYLRGNANEKE